MPRRGRQDAADDLVRADPSAARHPGPGRAVDGRLPVHARCTGQRDGGCDSYPDGTSAAIGRNGKVNEDEDGDRCRPRRIRAEGTSEGQTGRARHRGGGPRRLRHGLGGLPRLRQRGRQPRLPRPGRPGPADLHHRHRHEHRRQPLPPCSGRVGAGRRHGGARPQPQQRQRAGARREGDGRHRGDSRRLAQHPLRRRAP